MRFFHLRWWGAHVKTEKTKHQGMKPTQSFHTLFRVDQFHSTGVQRKVAHGKVHIELYSGFVWRECLFLKNNSVLNPKKIGMPGLKSLARTPQVLFFPSSSDQSDARRPPGVSIVVLARAETGCNEGDRTCLQRRRSETGKRDLFSLTVRLFELFKGEHYPFPFKRRGKRSDRSPVQRNRDSTEVCSLPNDGREFRPDSGILLPIAPSHA